MFRSYFLLVATLLVLQVTSHTLYITPDDHHSTNNSNTITLSQCVRNSEMCFTSNTQLFFWWGVHNLKEDFVIQNLNNITVIGNHSTINCANLSVGIAVINVTKIAVHNMKVVGCRKNYIDKLDAFNVPTYVDTKVLHRNAAVHMHYCVAVSVTNVSIIVSSGTDGIHVINAMMESTLSNILITVMTSSQSHNSTNDGLVVFYYMQAIMNVLYIRNITYKQTACNSKEIQNVLYISFQRNEYKILVRVDQTVFKDLCNVRALYYCSETNHNAVEVNLMSCQMHNNAARDINGFSMLSILHTSDNKDSLTIMNSMFYKNTNINSMINITNSFTRNDFIISIKNSTFNHNQAMSIIKDYTGEIAVLWHHPIIINIHDTTISSNTHSNGKSLISLNNGEIYCSKCKIVNNSYYENIIELHLSTFVITDYLDISNNHARYLIFL